MLTSTLNGMARRGTAGACLCLSILSGSEAQQHDPDPGLRARAWATIAGIHDDSVHSIEFHETVRVHFAGGDSAVMFEYDVLADDLRRVRVSGRRCHMDTSVGMTSHQCEAIDYQLLDGVVVSQSTRDDSTVVVTRFERPDHVDPWSLPGVLKGIGNAVAVHDIHSRAEQLNDCGDLRVLSEDGDSVFLQGSDTYYRSHPYRFTVSIDTRTGRVERYVLEDAVWDCPVTDWFVEEFVRVDGLNIPCRMQYRMYELAVPASQMSAIREARERAGLPREAMAPGHEQYTEWQRLRTEVLGGSTPVRLAAPWQSSEARIVAVNPALDQDRFALDVPARAMFFNAPFETPATGSDVLQPTRVQP